MAGYLVERLLGAEAGERVTVRPDWMVVNDGASHAAVTALEHAARPERVIVYHDHDVPTGRPEASAIYAELLAFARRCGTAFVQARGVGYLDMMDTRVQPGQIIACGGMHAGVYGAAGALGLRLGKDALAEAIRTGEAEVTVPQTLRVAVTGRLPEGTTMLDAALAWAGRADVSGRAVEFVAPGLSRHERMQLCAAAGMRGAFTALCADEGEAETALALEETVPMTMCPCSGRDAQPCAEIVPLSSIAGMQVHAGQIGGYTGGTLEDLRLAASLLREGTLQRGFRLSICPATAQDYLAAIDEGLIEQFVLYGAQVHAVGDRSVVVQGPGTIDRQETLLTTGLYTFSGCMGEPEGRVYTASVPAIIRASRTGRA